MAAGILVWVVDHRRVRLDHHVAEAADAWLNDPADTGAYARLVHAVLARRAYVHPVLGDTDTGEEAGPEALALPESLGDVLTGLDPRAVIAGLLSDSDPEAGG